MSKSYKQAFVIVMSTGTVALVVVFGDDPKHGKLLAYLEANAALDGQIWDDCAFPVSSDCPNEGVYIWHEGKGA